MVFRIAAFGLSDVGRVRTQNEDTIAVEPSRGILMVADGMGGAPGGEVASALAVQEVCRALHEDLEIREALLRANQKILDVAESNPDLTGMGTTLTVLHFDAETGAFQIGHVGDSRAYRVHGGALHQLTRDHTAVADMVRSGTLPAAKAEHHPMSHILSRALGTAPPPEVDVVLGQGEVGDRFLLCSDGLTKVFREEELKERLTREPMRRSPEDLCRELVEEANGRGAPDNVSVAVLAVEASR